MAIEFIVKDVTLVTSFHLITKNTKNTVMRLHQEISLTVVII